MHCSILCIRMLAPSFRQAVSLLLPGYRAQRFQGHLSPSPGFELMQSQSIIHERTGILLLYFCSQALVLWCSILWYQRVFQDLALQWALNSKSTQKNHFLRYLLWSANNIRAEVSPCAWLTSLLLLLRFQSSPGLGLIIPHFLISLILLKVFSNISLRIFSCLLKKGLQWHYQKQKSAFLSFFVYTEKGFPYNRNIF